jgi:hypothetical protein
MPTWAVLVVHGVGDTRPGATVDDFVPALTAARPGTIHPDGPVEVRWLRPDGYALPTGRPERAAPQKDSVFPVHVRTASIGPGLQLMSWGDGSGVPASGENLVIAGTDSEGLLHIRTFDAAGVRTDTFETRDGGGALHLVTADAAGAVQTDQAESGLPAARAGAITALKQKLPGWSSPHGLSRADRGQILAELTLIIGHAPPVTVGPGQADRSVFAEVYWADLSRIREGRFQSILALISTIFLIRFITDQAAVMPDQPEDPAADRARRAARWLRAVLYSSAWLLNAPIAALSLLLAGAVVVENLVLPHFPLSPGSPWGHTIAMMALGLAAGVGGTVAYYYGRGSGWGSTWTRAWGGLAWFGFLFAAVVLGHQFLPMDAMIARWVGYTPAPVAGGGNPAQAPGPIPPQILGPIVLVAGIQLAFGLITLAVVLALVPLTYALRQAPEQWQPGLWVSYGAALLQIALWMLLIPGLLLSTILGLVRDPARQQELRHLFGRIAWEFGLFLLVAAIVGVCAGAVWWWRGRRAGAYPGNYEYLGPVDDVPRLIVHYAIIGSIIVLTALVCVFSVASAVWDIPLAGTIASWAGLIAVPAFTVFFGYFGKGLRDSLHIITDVINHFYRRQDDFPRPWGPETKPRVPDFEIQQSIEARFRAVLKEVLRDPEVTRLSVISHSQGTVISVDVFSLANLHDPYRSWLIRRLEEVGGLNLITMGSPLHHLYQHYFPDRYSPLTHGWHGLRDSLSRWVNIYRIDDYIGTFVDVPINPPDPRWGSPNRPIHSGGHTEYWNQPAVFRAVCDKEPASLPG